jgi:tetratricopeptide (TPR) repeat protein
MIKQKTLPLAMVYALSLSVVCPFTWHQSAHADPVWSQPANKSLELVLQGDTLARSGQSAEATEKYLAAASAAFANQNFERARPFFDKAFLEATKLTSADQKHFLSRVSEIINHSPDRQDFDTYKYFAQNRLRLLKSKVDGTPAERYNEVQTIAFSCSQNHRYKEAIALLQESLADLQASAPQSDSVGLCLNTLAGISENSGDLPAACRYYESQIAFTKSTVDRRNYHRALESYTMFLIKHNLNKQLHLTAREFLDEIVRTGNTDRVPLQMIARGLAGCDSELSDKFYRLAFEQQKRETQSAMNIPYGDTVCEWVGVLHQAGHTDRAILVLQEGIAFCRTAKWPDSLDWNMKQMVGLLEQYLTQANRHAEADDAKSAYAIEMKSFKDRRDKEDWARIEGEINSPTAEPLIKVRALMEKADRDFIAGNCQEAINSVEQAVSVYEANAKNPQSSQIYDSLYNIMRRFQKCGREADAKSLLMRIVKARMVLGFRDPEEMTGWQSNCGGTSWAYDEVVGPFFHTPDKINKEMLELAKASGNRDNVIFVIDRMVSQALGERRVELLAELEQLRGEKSNKVPLLSTLLIEADNLAYLKRWDGAKRKCQEALALYQNNKEVHSTFPSLSGSFYKIGRQFFAAGQQEEGAELQLTAYELSLDHDRDVIIRMNLRFLNDLFEYYADKHDIVAAAKLYSELVDSTRAKLGPDNTFTRMWLIKMSTFYLRNGDVAKGKQAYSTLASSLFKTGLSVSADNEKSLADYAKVLTQAGCATEAARINAKLAELEQQHCGAHAK